MGDYGSGNNNNYDYSSNKDYLEKMNNYSGNNYGELKPIDNKKLLLKYSGNNDAPPKKIFEKDYLPKENKFLYGSDDIEEDIIKDPLPAISKPYLREPLRDHINSENRLNNLNKFNGNVIKPIQKNYDGVLNNNIGGLGVLKKKNFMDSEKDVLGMIKNNLERDAGMGANALIKNRDYSLNDNHLHRNYQINALNSNVGKDKGILNMNMNMNMNNVNNYNNNYNPVLTNVNKDLKYQIPSRNFDYNKKEREKKEYDSLFGKNDGNNNFNISKKKWDYESNNNEVKKENFVGNSRRKQLNPIRSGRRNRGNESELLSGKKDEHERNNFSSINNNNHVNNNNEEKHVKFDSRRQHLLHKI